VNEQPQLRIGDAEREAAVSALGEHYAAGRLTKEEYDERSESAWTARTSAELRLLFHDLPGLTGSHPAPAPVPAAPVRGGGWPLGVGVLPVLIGLFVLSVFVGHPVFLLVLIGALIFSGSRRSRRAGHYRQHYAHRQR
jgi:uncharacterized membrane protein